MTQMQKILTLFVGTIALSLGSLPAHSSTSCAPRAVVLKKLASQFEETRQSIGLSANNHVVETFAAPSGSWTVIVTNPRGLSCIVASGQAFERVTEGLPPEGAPT